MKNTQKTMREMIIEEAKKRPTLTKEETAKLLEPITEEDIQMEYVKTVCEWIDTHIKTFGNVPSDEQFRKIILEEKIKRNIPF